MKSVVRFSRFLRVLPLALMAIATAGAWSPLYAQPVLYGNSATWGPDLVHQIDKTTGVLIQNFTVSTGNGRGVVVVGNILYSTESGPSENGFGGSNQIYKTDLTTGLPLGSITVIGLPAGAAMSTLAWDGTNFWTSEYLGGNHAYQIDTSGNIIKTIVLGLAGSNMDGMEYFNGKLIVNRGDTVGPYDVYDLDGNVLQAAFIDPSTVGIGSTTGIAYDGTNFYTSDIFNRRLAIWDGTTGLSAGFLPLTGGSFLIEDLSVDYAQRQDTAVCGDGAINTDIGEQCDDGNTTSGDGCSATCQIEEQGPVCGNGTVESGEACDDGNTTSGDGCSATCQIENKLPVCSAATASPALLWPPNHQMVPIGILGVTDPDGNAVTIAATSVFQDERVKATGTGSGNTSPDATLSPLAVRAERDGTPKAPGNGRVYHINFTADDGHGGTCDGSVTVCVPHDQRPGSTCVDGGSLYDSLIP